MKKVPVIDMLKCTRCNICIDNCQKKAISVISNSCCAKCIKYCISFDVPCHPEYLIFDYDLCNSCGLCISTCPHSALSLADIDKANIEKLKNQ